MRKAVGEIMKKLMPRESSNREVGKVKRPGKLAKGTAFAGIVLAAGIMTSCDTQEKTVPNSGYSEMSRTLKEKMVATAPEMKLVQKELESAPELEQRKVTRTVRVGDNFLVVKSYLTEFALKVAKIDDKGVELENGSRWNYGEKQRCGEFALWTEMQVERGEEPGTAKVTIVTTVPKGTEQAETSDAITLSFYRPMGVGLVSPGAPGELAVGQVIWFGVTWRAMYGITVTGIDKETVTADIIMPVGSPLPAADIVSINVKINDVKIPRSEIEPFIKILGSAHEAATEDVTEETQFPCSFKVGPSRLPKKLPDVSAAVRAIYTGDLLRITAGVFAGKDSEDEVKAVDFVVESNDKEFILRIKGGEHDGKIVRLSREVDAVVEVLEEGSAFTLPYRLESLSIDEQGNVKVDVGVDCSRDVWMEPSVVGRHPSCEKQ